jgi:hypothetical protein
MLAGSFLEFTASVQHCGTLCTGLGGQELGHHTVGPHRAPLVPYFGDRAHVGSPIQALGTHSPGLPVPQAQALPHTAFLHGNTLTRIYSHQRDMRSWNVLSAQGTTILTQEGGWGQGEAGRWRVPWRHRARPLGGGSASSQLALWQTLGGRNRVSSLESLHTLKAGRLLGAARIHMN